MCWPGCGWATSVTLNAFESTGCKPGALARILKPVPGWSMVQPANETAPSVTCLTRPPDPLIEPATESVVEPETSNAPPKAPSVTDRLVENPGLTWSVPQLSVRAPEELPRWLLEPTLSTPALMVVPPE